MNSMNIAKQARKILRRMVRSEAASSTIELAIVFPILLIMFVGTAELGRLFYTYTSLAKATKTGARYLSTSRDATSPVAAEVTAAKASARNLVVCGNPAGCANETPIVPGLTTANVTICDNFSVPCSPVIPAGTIKYFKVEINN